MLLLDAGCVEDVVLPVSVGGDGARYEDVVRAAVVYRLLIIYGYRRTKSLKNRYAISVYGRNDTADGRVPIIATVDVLVVGIHNENTIHIVSGEGIMPADVQRSTVALGVVDRNNVSIVKPKLDDIAVDPEYRSRDR